MSPKDDEEKNEIGVSLGQGDEQEIVSALDAHFASGINARDFAGALVEEFGGTKGLARKWRIEYEASSKGSQAHSNFWRTLSTLLGRMGEQESGLKKMGLVELNQQLSRVLKGMGYRLVKDKRTRSSKLDEAQANAAEAAQEEDAEAVD